MKVFHLLWVFEDNPFEGLGKEKEGLENLEER